jgi:glycosyltransferase involved in cell wall biosynthesis
MGPVRRSFVRRCDWILAVSAFTATVLARRAHLAPARISVVPPPIEPAFADDAVDPRGSETGAESGADGRLLTVSALDPGFRYKGHFTIAESLPLLLEGRPRLRWVVVGDGPDLPMLRKRCDELGVTGSVDFRGSLTDRDLRDTYRHADVLVLPSAADPAATPPEGEGFGIAYAEAGAYAVPSVGSTAAGGASDFVIDGETGLTVPPHDPEALARATARLLEDSALRERLGAAARERVLARHLPTYFRTALGRALNEAR